MNTTINPAKVETIVIEPETISITLTKEEAGELASILGKVQMGGRLLPNSISGNRNLYGRLLEFIGGQNEYDQKFRHLYGYRNMMIPHNG